MTDEALPGPFLSAGAQSMVGANSGLDLLQLAYAMLEAKTPASSEVARVRLPPDQPLTSSLRESVSAHESNQGRSNPVALESPILADGRDHDGGRRTLGLSVTSTLSLGQIQR